MNLPRREFLLFSALSVGSTMIDRHFVEKAFADIVSPGGLQLGVDIVDYSDSMDSGSVGADAGRVIPSGRYAQSLIYAIAPEVLDVSTLLVGDDDVICFSQDLEGAAVIDVGIERDSETLVFRNADGDMADRTVLCSTFFDGTFEHLPDSILSLGELLGSDSSEDIARYMDEVVELVLSRQSELAKVDQARLYIASGESGLEAETFNYLQENVFKYLNVNCINDEVLAAMEEPESDCAFVVDLNRIMEADADYILFKDASIETVFDKASSPLSILWRKVPSVSDSRLLDIPQTEFSWLGSPLVSQGLGVLWLGSVLWPDIFDIDLEGFVTRYYDLFVHCSISMSDLPGSVMGEGGLS